MFRIPTAVAVAILLCTSASARTSSDRVQVGRRIVVDAGEKSGDLVCFACSIVVRGDADGDVVAIGGSITLEQDATTAGDVVAIAGSARAAAGVHVGGDLVAIGGGVRRDPDASIGGQVTSVGGAGLAILIVAFPLAMLAGIVALIVWLVQRNRQPQPAPYAGTTPNIR